MSHEERKIGDLTQRRYAVAEIPKKSDSGALDWLMDWQDFVGPIAYDPKSRSLIIEYPTAKSADIAWILNRIRRDVSVADIAFEVLHKAVAIGLTAKPRQQRD